MPATTASRASPPGFRLTRTHDGGDRARSSEERRGERDEGDVVARGRCHVHASEHFERHEQEQQPSGNGKTLQGDMKVVEYHPTK